MSRAEMAISNICWNDDQDPVALDAMRQSSVRYMDIAPAKAFPQSQGFDPTTVTVEEIKAFKTSLRECDIEVSGAQALTFGRKENILTSSPEDIKSLQHYMKGIVHLGELAGAQTLVYGSGGTRTYSSLSDSQVFERAAEFFVPLATEAYNSGIVLGIEPVSTTWTKGSSVFGRTGQEIVDFTARIRNEHGTRNLAFVPDSFAMYDGEDDPEAVLNNAALQGVLAPHLQVAEPGMAPIMPRSAIAAYHNALDAAFAPHLQQLGVQFNAMPIIAAEAFHPQARKLELSGPDLEYRTEDDIKASTTAMRSLYKRSLAINSF